jgi:hypothetical protein
VHQKYNLKDIHGAIYKVDMKELSRYRRGKTIEGRGRSDVKKTTPEISFSGV